VKVCCVGGYFPDVRLADADEDVLGLDIGVNDLALGVKIVEPLQDLLHDELDVEKGDALVVTPDDKLEEVVAEHLEDHADVGSVDAANLEIVQKLYAPFPEWISLVALSDALEQLDFVEGRLGVVRRALHHLEGHEVLVRQVPAQPDRRKVAPAEFSDHVVSVVK